MGLDQGFASAQWKEIQSTPHARPPPAFSRHLSPTPLPLLPAVPILNSSAFAPFWHLGFLAYGLLLDDILVMVNFMTPPV